MGILRELFSHAVVGPDGRSHGDVLLKRTAKPAAAPGTQRKAAPPGGKPRRQPPARPTMHAPDAVQGGRGSTMPDTSSPPEQHGEEEPLAPPPVTPPNAGGPKEPSSPNVPSGPQPISGNLRALFKQARSDPYNETGHGVIADAIEEEYPGSPFPELIRRQFGVGNHAGNAAAGEMNWYEPVNNSWDGTFSYAARLGAHGPFDLYLGHEGTPEVQGSNQRWVVHAVARVNHRRPELNDTGYSFEWPHERAHKISQMFPAAGKHINPQDYRDVGGDLAPGARENEAEEFARRMDEEEAARG